MTYLWQPYLCHAKTSWQVLELHVARRTCWTPRYHSLSGIMPECLIQLLSRADQRGESKGWRKGKRVRGGRGASDIMPVSNKQTCGQHVGSFLPCKHSAQQRVCAFSWFWGLFVDARKWMIMLLKLNGVSGDRKRYKREMWSLKKRRKLKKRETDSHGKEGEIKVP